MAAGFLGAVRSRIQPGRYVHPRGTIIERLVVIEMEKAALAKKSGSRPGIGTPVVGGRFGRKYVLQGTENNHPARENTADAHRFGQPVSQASAQKPPTQVPTPTPQTIQSSETKKPRPPGRLGKGRRLF